MLKMGIYDVVFIKPFVDVLGLITSVKISTVLLCLKTCNNLL